MQSGRGRPRTKCPKCSPPKRPKAAEPVAVVSARVAEIRPGATTEIPTLVQASTARLRDAGRLDDPASVVVLQLARAIDDGGHSGASLASLSKEFRAALDQALADVQPAAADDGVAWEVG